MRAMRRIVIFAMCVGLVAFATPALCQTGARTGGMDTTSGQYTATPKGDSEAKQKADKSGFADMSKERNETKEEVMDKASKQPKLGD